MIITSFILSFIMAFNSHAGTTAPRDKKIVLGFSQVGVESIWRQANTKSIESAAAEAGIDLVIENGLQRQENQIRAIRRFLLQKVDVIALSPVVKSGWREVLLEAKQHHVPVVLIDRGIDKAEQDLVEVMIASDFREEGRQAARCLVRLIKERNLKHPNKAPARLLEILGTEGSSPAIDRRAGFAEVLAGESVIEPVQVLGGDFRQGVAREKVAALLAKTKQRPFDIVFAHNDDMALGAIVAMENVGLKPGQDIYVASVDGTKAAVEAIVQGKLNCSMECSPLLGPDLMRTVRSLAHGETLPKRLTPKEILFSPANAEQALGGRPY